MTDSSPLGANEENLLQSALETAFEPAPVPRVSALPPPPSASPPPEPVLAPQSALDASSAPTEEDAWKAEHEVLVQTWRAQSAEAREKAERERARWEDIRKREAAQLDERRARGELISEPEPWESLGSFAASSSSSAAAPSIAATSGSPAPTDMRDLVTGEAQGPSSHIHPGSQHVKTESGSPSQKWVDVPSSPTSSYPSMSFPEPSGPPSPSARAAQLQHADTRSSRVQTHTRVAATERDTGKPGAPPSLLPPLLDGTLMPRTRMSLLLSSLAINLFLPFVNGVMLGFGEIFAKNVLVGWFGWKSQGNGRTATKVGLR